MLRLEFVKILEELKTLRLAQGTRNTFPVNVPAAPMLLSSSDVEAGTMRGSLRPYDEGQEALMSYEGGRNRGLVLPGGSQPDMMQHLSPRRAADKGSLAEGGTLMGFSGIILGSIGESYCEQNKKRS